MTELIQVATQRRLQLIVTTHSPYVLEQLPPEARIYLRPTRDGRREPLYGVTPDYALSLMDDDQHPELFAYCEDDRAVPIIEGIVRLSDQTLIRRIKVVTVGPAATVRALGKLSALRNLPELGIGVLDADQEPAPGCIRLPGKSAPPEVNVFNDMTDSHIEVVAERLGIRAGDLLDAADDARRLPDHHTWPQRIAERLGGTMRTSKVWDSFVDVWIRDVLSRQERAAFIDQLANQIPTIQDLTEDAGG